MVAWSPSAARIDEAAVSEFLDVWFLISSDDMAGQRGADRIRLREPE
jgi:hypothetical protein